MHSLSVEMSIISPSGGVWRHVLVIIAAVHVVSCMFHCSPFLVHFEVSLRLDLRAQ